MPRLTTIAHILAAEFIAGFMQEHAACPSWMLPILETKRYSVRCRLGGMSGACLATWVHPKALPLKVP